MPKVVLTREYHRKVLEKQDAAETEFAYFDLPFCSGIHHHDPQMRFYYIPWQFCVLPYAIWLAFSRKVTMVQHVTYNAVDFPGLLWTIPGTAFIWGSIGGGQIPPASLKSYYGRDWKKQIRRAFIKRMSRVNPLVRLALRRARVVFAANTDTYRILEPLVPNKARLHRVLETAVHTVGQARTLQAAPIRVVWIGRFEPRKAPRLAVEIARRIEQIAPGSFVFRLIGEGEMWDEIAGLAATNANVTINRPVPFLEMDAVYAQADLLLFTSLQDTSGNVVLESMARGIPVVAFDHQGAADMLAEGGGRLVPPSTPEQSVEGFCRAILALAAPQAYAAASQEAVANVTKNYLWSAKRDVVLRLIAESAMPQQPVDVGRLPP